METISIGKVWFVLLLAVFTVASNGYGQHVLALDKKGKKKRVHFRRGDDIKVKLDDGSKLHGQITSITDTSFFINDNEVMLHTVAVVYRKRSPIFPLVGGFFLTGAAVLMGVNLINSVINDNDPLDTGVWIVSGSAAAVGGLLLLLSEKRHKVYQNGTFRSLDVTPIPIKEE